MYQTREKIQSIILLLADLICFAVSYFGGGYLWLVGYRNVSVANMKIELMESFGIVMVVYMLVMLFSDIDNRFIDRSVFQELWAAIKASVVLVCVTALTIFLQHNNAEASRGVYFCIALVNMCLYFGMHIIIKYYLLHVYRNKRANNQVFLVTTAERVEAVSYTHLMQTIPETGSIVLQVLRSLMKTRLENGIMVFLSLPLMIICSSM